MFVVHEVIWIYRVVKLVGGVLLDQTVLQYRNLAIGFKVQM